MLRCAKGKVLPLPRHACHEFGDMSRTALEREYNLPCKMMSLRATCIVGSIPIAKIGRAFI